jgi:hypothetical protein
MARLFLRRLNLKKARFMTMHFECLSLLYLFFLKTQAYKQTGVYLLNPDAEAWTKIDGLGAANQENKY